VSGRVGKANRDKETPQHAPSHRGIAGPPASFPSTCTLQLSPCILGKHTLFLSFPGHRQLDIPFSSINYHYFPTTTTTTTAALLTYANPMTRREPEGKRAKRPRTRTRFGEANVARFSSLLRVKQRYDTIRYDTIRCPRTGMDDHARTHARCAAPAYQSPTFSSNAPRTGKPVVILRPELRKNLSLSDSEA
jgi:hypothetical protein